jgi:hypothetical protein
VQASTPFAPEARESCVTAKGPVCSVAHADRNATNNIEMQTRAMMASASVQAILHAMVAEPQRFGQPENYI